MNIFAKEAADLYLLFMRKKKNYVQTANCLVFLFKLYNFNMLDKLFFLY